MQQVMKELKQIKELIASPEYKGTQVEKNTDDFLQSPSWGRIALELGGGIVGSVATGGLGLPLLAARVAMLSRPFLMALGKSSAGSFGGGFAGSILATAIVAQTQKVVAFRRDVEAVSYTHLTLPTSDLV